MVIHTVTGFNNYFNKNNNTKKKTTEGKAVRPNMLVPRIVSLYTEINLVTSYLILLFSFEP